MEDEAIKTIAEDSQELFHRESQELCRNSNFEINDMGPWGNDKGGNNNVSDSGNEIYDLDYKDEEQTSLKSGFSGRSRGNSKKEQIHAQMLSYKQQGSYDIPEDVYAFITVAPVTSYPFVFACLVIAIKYIVYVSLLFDIQDYQPSIGEETSEKIATAVKFFLIPVTVAMQEDLMAVYAGLANARYDDKVLRISTSATKTKFALAYLLQLIDGILSLIVNFHKMLLEKEILNVFLNFAALHFLQDIDDVFYALVEKGFFGDRMEHMATVCKQISWPRRAGTTKFSRFLTKLDFILFTLTFGVCLVVYIVFTTIETTK